MCFNDLLYQSSMMRIVLIYLLGLHVRKKINAPLHFFISTHLYDVALFETDHKPSSLQS